MNPPPESDMLLALLHILRHLKKVKSRLYRAVFVPFRSVPTTLELALNRLSSRLQAAQIDLRLEHRLLDFKRMSNLQSRFWTVLLGCLTAAFNVGGGTNASVTVQVD